MDAKTRRIAAQELRKLKAQKAAYEADVADWYENGDGRKPEYEIDPETGRQYNIGGKGYTFPYCEHGSSLWTDYDNICGGCEDGYSIHDLARWRAMEKMAEFEKRVAWVGNAPKSLDPDTRSDLIEWMFEAIR